MSTQVLWNGKLILFQETSTSAGFVGTMELIISRWNLLGLIKDRRVRNFNNDDEKQDQGKPVMLMQKVLL